MNEKKKLNGTKKRFETNMIALYGFKRLFVRLYKEGDANLTLYYAYDPDPGTEVAPGAPYGHVGTWQKGGGWYYEPLKRADEVTA